MTLGTCGEHEAGAFTSCSSRSSFSCAGRYSLFLMFNSRNDREILLWSETGLGLYRDIETDHKAVALTR